MDTVEVDTDTVSKNTAGHTSIYSQSVQCRLFFRAVLRGRSSGAVPQGPFFRVIPQGPFLRDSSSGAV